MAKNQQVIENKTPVAEQAAAQHHPPVATIGIIAITALFTSLFFYPALLPTLDRNLEALRAGQWWRLVTPRLVNPEIGAQYILLAILALVGPAVERRFGSLRWLALWFAGGLMGEVVSFAWQPQGAGASVGICGIIGAWLMLLIHGENLEHWVIAVVTLAFNINLVGIAAGSPLFAAVTAAIVAGLVIQLRRREALWHQITPYLGLIGLLGGLILTALRDQHGSPLLVGAGTAALFLLIEM